MRQRPASEALILPEGTELAGKCLTVRNRKSYCVAGAIALNGGTMPESSRILLLHIANVRREGMTFKGRGVLVTDWGGGAMLAQRAVADFSLELPAGNWKLYALDFPDAARKRFRSGWRTADCVLPRTHSVRGSRFSPMS